MPRLARVDFAKDPVSLAQDLLGCLLVRRLDGQRLSARIVETEAYCGPEDKAAHSVGWRRTPRTEPMFGPPGTAYVFLTYGMHHCFNVVCGAEGEPVAVLVRAAEPVDGIDAMRRRRSARPRAKPLRDALLTSGPARLCEALAIDRSLSGIDLARHPGIWLERDDETDAVQRSERVNCPRIGVDYAEEWAAAPLRWYARSSAYVSRRAAGDRRPRRA